LKNTYFLSDFHLGTPNHASSLLREKKIIAFLDSIKNQAEAIYFVGDIFDFWFEYKTVVPKGFVRLLGKIAELKDAGIAIYIFTGNHDLWMLNYFEEEFGIPVFRNAVQHTIQGKHFFIGHGDGLGPGDMGYKWMKKVFTNPFCQWLFRWLHPDIGVGIANSWSRSSRKASNKKEEKSFGTEEWLLQYAKRKLTTAHYDYFIFGHRHLPLDMEVTAQSRYINLGDWLNYDSYAVMENGICSLKYYS
jgi:UDP-2,3-diacylglucosamine hydrolase